MVLISIWWRSIQEQGSGAIPDIDFKRALPLEAASIPWYTLPVRSLVERGARPCLRGASSVGSTSHHDDDSSAIAALDDVRSSGQFDLGMCVRLHVAVVGSSTMGIVSW